MSEDEVVALKNEWYKRGYNQAQQEIRDDLCRLLGLDDRYVTREEWNR